jgi:hypothetical protein
VLSSCYKKIKPAQVKKLPGNGTEILQTLNADRNIPCRLNYAESNVTKKLISIQTRNHPQSVFGKHDLNSIINDFFTNPMDRLLMVFVNPIQYSILPAVEKAKKSQR